MEKLLPLRNERGSAGIWFAALGSFALFNGGMNIAHVVQLDKAREELKQNEQEIQIYHDQVADELSGHFSTIDQLALVSHNGTITFKTKNEAGEIKSCKGEYEVSHDTAALVGTIACTQTDTVKIAQ